MFDKLKKVLTGYGPGPNTKVIDDRQKLTTIKTEELSKVLNDKSPYELWCDENPDDHNCRMFDV